MDQGTLQGIGTILAMIAFLGVCWWAFSKHKKKDFEEAANLPFEGDELAEENEKRQKS
ncbi:MAG: cbb3-type cytochrome oxidase subunit 3 [bacterium]